MWRALVHDFSKFLPSEWFPYAEAFYLPHGQSRYQESEAFNVAWNNHQKRNKHHWQYWLITWDRGETEPLEMPHDFTREMVADWMGAGRAINGRWEVREWYNKNKDKIKLHPITREWVLTFIFQAEETRKGRKLNVIVAECGAACESLTK
jgi:hypothetical protein